MSPLARLEKGTGVTMAARLEFFGPPLGEVERPARLYVPARSREGERELGALAVALALREPAEVLRPVSTDEPAARLALAHADLALGEPACGVAVRWRGWAGTDAVQVPIWIPATHGRADRFARQLVARSPLAPPQTPSPLFEAALLGARPLACFGADGSLLYANPAARLLLGADARLLGREILRAAPPPDADGPALVLLEGRRLLVDPRRPLEEGALLVAFDDVRPRAAVDDPPTWPEASSIDLASLAHDLRNPLGCAAANLRFVQERLGGGTPQAAELHDALRDALEGLDCAVALVDGAAELLGPQVGARPPERAEVGPVLDQAVRVARLRLRGSARIELEVEAVPEVVGGRTIGRVLLNLLLNAGTALREAGRQGRIAVRCRPNDGGVEVLVEDDGPGVDTNDRARLFRPWFTTRRGRGGTGIGLAASRRHVEAVGGTLAYVERPAAGATFRLWLPAAPLD